MGVADKALGKLLKKYGSNPMIKEALLDSVRKGVIKAKAQLEETGEVCTLNRVMNDLKGNKTFFSNLKLAGVEEVEVEKIVKEIFDGKSE